MTAADLSLADLYEARSRPEETAGALEDVRGGDWRNILVLGRATRDGVYPETLALVGRARYLADELGCRVEVLLIGENLLAATAELKRYPIDTIYRVKAPDYAPIDHTAKVLEQVIRKRRPELILVFQSRSGDAVAAFTASRLGVGFVIGATQVSIDTAARRAVATHEAASGRFLLTTSMLDVPQIVSVQRGLFRAPLEAPYSQGKVHDLQVDAGRLADIEVHARREPPQPTLETAERVVLVGARIRDAREVDAARRLAQALDAQFAVTVGIVERGFLATEQIVGVGFHRIQPRLLVTVGVRGGLDLLDGISGDPTICAIGCDVTDPICKHAAYVVTGEVLPGLEGVLRELGTDARK